ncbi:hypothetical protein [Halogranum rubrum]|uniref:Uncharacterized protein n=1 Tax=Halogranum salarium B-1 TaxID=1210908 RepID=J3A4D9_9EURY|nr:hypothetical protein [Halogranum salarium]EJN60323.1 hypothetical protein HSB1_09260 [Halogranum salarium B-1]
MSDETDETNDADEQTTDAHDADADESTDEESDVTDVVTVEHAPDAVEDAAETAVDTVTDAGELVEEAQSLLQELVGLDDDPESHERAQELLDDLHAVADESEDVIGTINFEELPDAIDASGAHTTIDAGELPDAIASGDPGDAVELRNIHKLVELGDLWSAVDVREFWRNKREFDDAVDDLFGGDDDDGWFEGEWFEDDWFDDEDASADADGAEDTESDSMAPKPELGMLDTDESKQAAIQKKISESVGEFRGSILDARERLKEVVEQNKEESRQAGQPNSRNPTAVSTLPRSRSDIGGATRFSTIPEETRYSTAPNRPRIYGQRFDDAKENQNND